MTLRWLSVGLLLAACTDEGGPEAEPSCERGARRCDGVVLEECNAHEFVPVDCPIGQGCVDDGEGARCEMLVGQPCNEGDQRCVDDVLERCTDGAFRTETDCAALGQVCASGSPPVCAAIGWVHVPITIDDPIVNGTSLVVPVDGVSFGHDPQAGAFITAFGRDFDNPGTTFLWHVDEAAGTHTKKLLVGTTFDVADELCAGEQWCQLIGFDPLAGEWVVAGPAAPAIMRVTPSYQATLVSVSGPQPPASYINHGHRFAWATRQLFLYGATGPSSFSDTVSALDLDTGVWSEPATGLPEIDDNCLAFDPAGTLYSVAGRVTTDGGNTVDTLSTYLAIDVASGAHTTHDLPVEIGARSNMACAFDEARQLVYVFGGALVNDVFDEAQNVYHNDLWALDVGSGEWTQILADTESGTLGPPDSYGDQPFTGHPEGPNFGKNRGYLQIDTAADRLTIIGAVPQLTHEQLYVLPLGDLL